MKMEIWRNSLSDKDKKAMYDKRNQTMHAIYEENLKLYGSKRNPEIVKRVQNKYIENGHSLIVHTYFPDGTFFKTFKTGAEALRFVGEKSKNTGSLTLRLDKEIFRGLIFSQTLYDKYPIENIKPGEFTECVVTNLDTNEQSLCKNFKQVHKEFGIPRGRLYAKNFVNNIYKYNQYEIEIVAPVIGDNHSAAGEFIKNLYKNKDNNELSNELTSIESAETNS